MDCPSCAALRDKVEELEEHVRRLRGILTGDAGWLAGQWRLSRAEVAILNLLLVSPLGYASYEAILAALEEQPYRRGKEPLSENSLHVHLAGLRKAVAPDLVIETKYAQGLQLTPASLRHLRDLRKAAA